MARKDIERTDSDRDDEVEVPDPSAETVEATDPNGDPLTIELTEAQIREHEMEAGYIDGEPPEEVVVDEDNVDESV